MRKKTIIEHPKYIIHLEKKRKKEFSLKNIPMWRNMPDSKKTILSVQTGNVLPNMLVEIRCIAKNPPESQTALEDLCMHMWTLLVVKRPTGVVWWGCKGFDPANERCLFCSRLLTYKLLSSCYGHLWEFKLTLLSHCWVGTLKSLEH